MWVYHNLFNHLFFDGYLGHFNFLHYKKSKFKTFNVNVCVYFCKINFEKWNY